MTIRGGRLPYTADMMSGSDTELYGMPRRAATCAHAHAPFFKHTNHDHKTRGTRRGALDICTGSPAGEYGTAQDIHVQAHARAPYFSRRWAPRRWDSPGTPHLPVRLPCRPEAPLQARRPLRPLLVLVVAAPPAGLHGVHEGAVRAHAWGGEGGGEVATEGWVHTAHRLSVRPLISTTSDSTTAVAWRRTHAGWPQRAPPPPPLPLTLPGSIETSSFCCCRSAHPP